MKKEHQREKLYEVLDKRRNQIGYHNHLGYSHGRNSREALDNFEDGVRSDIPSREKYLARRINLKGFEINLTRHQ